MILGVNGRAITTKRTLDLTPDQVRWFLNGKAFLRHVQDLKHVDLGAFCQTCYAKGLPDDVMVGLTADDAYVLRCAHQQRTVTRAEVRETDELLAKIGWSLHCTAECARMGMFDGVEGNNDPRDGTVAISCGCTDRKFMLAPVGAA